MTPEESKKQFMEAKASFLAFLLALRAEVQAFAIMESKNIKARVCLN